MADVVQDLMVAFRLRTRQDLARLFEVEPQAVSNWKSRGLPSSQKLRAIRLAKERHVELPESVIGGAEEFSHEEPATVRSATAAGERGAVPACHLTIGPNGRLQLPEELLAATGLKAGDSIIVEVEGGDLRLRSLDKAIAEMQAMVRRFVPEDVSLVDELIAERRREAERE